MRIKGKLTREEFVNVCRNKGMTNTDEINNRYQNYMMCFEGLNDGRTAAEVGAMINEQDLINEDKY